jgi:branched-chain amino acid transport system ATP-binding protein
VSGDALRLEGIRAAYGRIEVLRGVDLSVPAGGVVALLGANGVGKSTLLKVASGLLRPTAGEIVVRGAPVAGGSTQELTKAGVCLVPEGRGVFPTLTVEENLTLASYFGVPAADLAARAYEIFPKLATRRRQRAGSMSGGEQQMLALGRALASRPAVLLLDELSTGLAPKVVDELYGVVADEAAQGMTVLLVEQYADKALDIAGSAAVMQGGRIVAAGDPAEIRNRLEELYLGDGAGAAPEAATAVPAVGKDGVVA